MCVCVCVCVCVYVMEEMVMCRLGVEVQLEQLSARCEQPDNKNTRNSKLYFTSNRVVALFTGGRSSATRYNGEDD